MPRRTTDGVTQQFEDVKEKLEDLIPQLERFKQNITTTTVDGDPEETNRRKGLATCVPRLIAVVTPPDDHCSTFKQVEELSKKLLAKNAIARFVDKGKDSGLVVKLIERFREAIVCYQVDNYCPSIPTIIDRNRSRNSRISTLK